MPICQHGHYHPAAAAETGHGHSHGLKDGIIDVHHHIMPPARLAAMRAAKMGDGPTMEWTLDKTLKMMESGKVSTTIISIPNNPVAKDVLQHVCRECNEYTTKLGIDYPGMFGTFACLPMPDVDASLREIEYVFDTLKADGIVLQTSYQNRWLGDPAFAALMDELNRRKAVVFIHPTCPDCCKGVQPKLREATVEFGTDTTRTIASLIFEGTAKRCPDIKFIFSHGGGSLTSLVARFPEVAKHVNRGDLKLDRGLITNVEDAGPMAALGKFYYDIAQVTHAVPMEAIIKLVKVSQVMFGTDFPWRFAEEHTSVLEELNLSPADLRAINRDNALKLLPKFRN